MLTLVYTRKLFDLWKSHNEGQGQMACGNDNTKSADGILIPTAFCSFDMKPSKQKVLTCRGQRSRSRSAKIIIFREVFSWYVSINKYMKSEFYGNISLFENERNVKAIHTKLQMNKLFDTLDVRGQGQKRVISDRPQWVLQVTHFWDLAYHKTKHKKMTDVLTP